MSTITPRPDKRFRVTSVVDGRGILMDSFDRKLEAQQFADSLRARMRENPQDHFALRSRLVIVDTREETMELAGENGV